MKDKIHKKFIMYGGNYMNNDKMTLDSREVAEMVGKNHAHLIRDIQRYVKYISNSEKPKLDSQDFFIEDAYKVASNNKTYKCYKVTKMGCEMIAHKMTGEKGTIFTAAYIERFHEMEGQLQQQNEPKALSEPSETLSSFNQLMSLGFDKLDSQLIFVEAALQQKKVLQIAQAKLQNKKALLEYKQKGIIREKAIAVAHGETYGGYIEDVWHDLSDALRIEQGIDMRAIRKREKAHHTKDIEMKKRPAAAVESYPDLIQRYDMFDSANAILDEFLSK